MRASLQLVWRFLVAAVPLCSLVGFCICDDSFGLQAPTNVASCAEYAQRRHHYHPDLPTASRSLLQLYHQHVQEDLGPKAVRTPILPCFGGGGEHLSRLSASSQRPVAAASISEMGGLLLVSISNLSLYL